METKMRVMSDRPLNAETPVEHLRSWITANSVFFDRNQGAFPEELSLPAWRLQIEGEVENPLAFSFDEILRMPKAIVANTLECSGNGRSLLKEKAAGNPWTIGGVGNAVWGGVWLRDLLKRCGLKETGRHVAFEGSDRPLGSAGVKFIRSIPVEKAMESTLLAYEMNGEPLPFKHGYPLRALALGWTGANCVKWLWKITAIRLPFEGFFMDNVYRVFQKGEDPRSGRVVTRMSLKSIITQPLNGETLGVGPVTVLGAAYAGETPVTRVDISIDGGKTWVSAEMIGPREPYAWRQWQFVWDAGQAGDYTLLARAIDASGRKQPMKGRWNVLGYCNNGVMEHAIEVKIG
ncbi:MAG: sulfite oxidase [Desulfobacteraceae bacterium]|nr:MAG: sulfite oxidase [Desulfobacteraceae bacterium]